MSPRDQSRAPSVGQAPVVGLDVLRFAAAVGVMLFRFCYVPFAMPDGAVVLVFNGARTPDGGLWAYGGECGVPMFFVISGFVIAWSAQGSSANEFARRRILRLMPGVWLYGTIALVLSLAMGVDDPQTSVARYLATLVLWPSYRPGWIDWAFWTLPIEIAFYALVFALLRLGRMAWLEPVVSALGALSATLWLLAASGLAPGLAAFLGKRSLELLLMTHGCFFALGTLGFIVATQGARGGRLALCALFVAGGLCQLTNQPELAALGLAGWFSKTYVCGLFLVFVAAMVVSVAGNARLLAAAPAWLPRASRRLGLATYPVYLLHTFVGSVAIREIGPLGLSPGANLAFGVATVVAVSLVLSATLEAQLRRRLARGLDSLTGWAGSLRPA